MNAKLQNSLIVLTNTQKKHDLQIISVATNENQHGAVVLFEGNEPKYKW